MDARAIEQEWLDELPPDDPRARRSRRDLVRINALMGNGRIVAAALRRVEGLRSIAEIGAGNGLFLLRTLRALRPESGARAVLLDRQPIVAGETLAQFAVLGWHAEAVAADAFDWLEDRSTPSFDAIVANLFLHHFEPERLARLLDLVSRRTRVFVACEPRRSIGALAGARLLGLVGCNDVSRHDAVVSVRAGFGPGEIASLWPAYSGWTTEEGARGLFSHGFVARAGA